MEIYTPNKDSEYCEEGDCTSYSVALLMNKKGEWHGYCDRHAGYILVPDYIELFWEHKKLKELAAEMAESIYLCEFDDDRQYNAQLEYKFWEAERQQSDKAEK